jgi:hypothetical protein
MENTPTAITIPEQRHRAGQPEAGSSPSSYSSSPSSPEPSPKTPSRAAQKQKQLHARRPSLLSWYPRIAYGMHPAYTSSPGSAFTQQECTTIKIGDDPEGPMRLVSLILAST